MSTYYEFYVGKKVKDRIEAIGPYVRCEDEYRLIPIVNRSRSFINWDEFGAWTLPVNMMAEEQVEFFSSEGWAALKELK